MNDDMTNVVMSSADWQRNEQRHLRREKRFVALIVLLVLLLVGSNVSWLIYESQFEVVEETITETTITQDNANGYNNYIGNDGDIVNGETDNKN
jgi:ABC-type Na+ efflux pump permease subunit